MSIVSIVGRLLFVSIFVLSAYHEFSNFGVDGGPAAKVLRPKIYLFSYRVEKLTGLNLRLFQVKYLIAGAIAMKGLGSLLFVFGSSVGAYLLLLHQALAAPILYDFYNYGADHKQFPQLFVKFTQNLALFGALLFYIDGMKKSMPKTQVKKKAPKSKRK